MRIIKPGKPKRDRKYSGTCKDCGCVVECEESETHVDPDPREQGAHRYVKCPTNHCGNDYLWVTKK